MIGEAYWSTGIELKPSGREWSISLDFCDDGFCKDGSTNGTLCVRYVVDTEKLASAIDTLLADAERLGIVWNNAAGGPTVYMEHDGEFEDGDRPDLRRVANEQAQRIGWQQCYSRELVA